MEREDWYPLGGRLLTPSEALPVPILSVVLHNPSPSVTILLALRHNASCASSILGLRKQRNSKFLRLKTDIIFMIQDW